MTAKFPHLLAAVEARAKHLNDAEGRDQWAIGAAVIKDCYPDGYHDVDRPRGPQTGTLKLLETAAKELAKHGYHEYHRDYLRQMAVTANSFPLSRRYSDLSFTAHQAARNPDILDWIVKQAGGVEELSVKDVKDWVSRWSSLQENKRREKIEAVKKKKKQAKTLQEKRDAAAELKELGTPMPKGKDISPPDKQGQSELALMVEVLDIDVDAMSVVKTLRANLSKLHKAGEVSPDFSEALIEHHEQIIEVAKQIVSMLKQAKLGKFTTIQGGKSA